ncbi:MAG: sigma-54 dependent transcriptional regulator [Gemmatimonadetes bacterium]|nr:sigma-54 dependent transcriptional regulator [Gemmatimonadota bacterium]
MNPFRILVVDDDPDIATFVRAVLRPSGVVSEVAQSGFDALRIAVARPPDLILLDLALPDLDGVTLLQAMRERGLTAPTVLITAYGSMQKVVGALEGGVDGVIGKPLREETLLQLIDRYRRRPDVNDLIAGLPHLAAGAGLGAIIGVNRAMVEVYEAVGRLAKRDCAVLLMGETGTGKELIARAMHEHSGRKGEFLAVNCAAVPEALLESELFGHERGAFTGAVQTRQGKLERAADGTFLLDEIGDMPPDLQPKLLRVVEERAVERVGGNGTHRLSTRFISATHHDITQLVADGRFREDLYYRLAVATIRIPPLRERPDDIGLLVEHYVQRLAPQLDSSVRAVDPQVLRRFRQYRWPGNVRELRNVIERSMIHARGPVLRGCDIRGLPDAGPEEPRASDPTLTPLDHAERACIEHVLAETHGNRSEAARRLGIHRNTLRRKLRAFGIADSDAA